MAGSNATVLFLCTGNYYRSRFAEALFNHLAFEAALTWRADSRGLAIERLDKPDAMCPDAVARLEALGIHLQRPLRFPISATDDVLAAADRIIALKRAEHHPLLQRTYPAWVDRVEYWHIHDADVAPPEQALVELEQQVRQLLDRFAARLAEA